MTSPEPQQQHSRAQVDEYYYEHTSTPPQALSQATPLEKIHEHRKKAVKDIEETEAETGVVLKNETSVKTENGKRLELTNRVAFEEQKVNMGRLPIWLVNAIGSMTPSELSQFRTQYRDELSINELITLDFMDKVQLGDKDAVKAFWDIQLKMMNKTNIQNQINIAVNKPDAVVSNLLDEIANKIKNSD